MRTKHQDLSLEDSSVAQRKMDSHLVAVEVSVERSTCERVKLNGLAFDHARLECLDAETVKCWRTVEKHRMAFHHKLEDVEYDRIALIDNLLGRLDGLDDATLDELADDEWLVQFGSHKLRKTALVHLQLRTYDDNRT